jgi:hypothetical protein
VPVRISTALRYEGASRDWPVDANGQYQRVHWVDQAFALGCLIRKGAIKSDPSIGNTLFEIKYLGGDNLAAEIEDRMRTATPVQSLLRDGSASIYKIDHSWNRQGQLRVGIYYRNLVVDPNAILRAPEVIV